MTCSCCEAGRCCAGGSCTTSNKSKCAYDGSTDFTAGGDCATNACIDMSGYSFCQLSNYCNCKNILNRRPTTVTSCDCNALRSAGYGDGCPWRYCYGCDSSGYCVSTCGYPRECCNGTCCPFTQRCVNGNCVNKCSSSTTFCQTSATDYQCCQAGEKCCGTSGCLTDTSQKGTFTVTVGNQSVVDTGLSGTGPVTWSASGTATNSFTGATVGPNGDPNNRALTEDNGFTCNGAELLYSWPGSGWKCLGASGTLAAPILYSGTLKLRANGPSGWTGTYTVRITYGTDPCPDYTPASIGEPIVYAAGVEPPKLLPGPGDALKSILRVAGIVASPTCSCNARASQMDAWGEWESLKRLPEICGWLKEEADKREMWFFRPAGYALVVAAVLLSALKRPFQGNNK